MKKKREKAVIRSSRKGYLIYYLMAIFIGVILIYIKLNDIPLPKNLLIASIVFIILLIKSTEIHRNPGRDFEAVQRRGGFRSDPPP